MTQLTRALFLATLVFAVGQAPLQAQDHMSSIRQFSENKVAAWIAQSIVIEAVKAQNQRHATLTRSEIDSLDIQWRTETVLSARPLIDEVASSDLSRHLARLKSESDGVVNEIFVMDNKGVNVAVSDPTSDYWQGDEAKWQETFLVGPGALHIGPVEHDASTDKFQTQLSMAITDPDTGEAIGAITVSLDTDRLVNMM